MFRQIYNHLRIDSMNDAGKLANYLNLPVEKRTKLRIPYMIFKIILFFIIKYAYVGLFIYIPFLIMSAKHNSLAFPFETTIIYFSICLSCVCGSLINTAIFDLDDDAYYLLVTLRFRPDSFFVGRIFLKLGGDFIGFLTAFLLFEIPAGVAFYLTVWILIGRVIGEAINLYIYRYLGKSIHELHAFSTVLMGLSVVLAYVFPYMRGYVVDLTKITYNYIWLSMGLAVAAIIFYRLLTYDGYGVVARKFSNRISEEIDEEIEDRQFEIDFLMEDMATSGKDFKPYDQDSSKGINFLHKVFHFRNKQYVKNSMFVRLLIVLAVSVAIAVICALSKSEVREMIWRMESNCLPLMVFVMFCLSVAPSYNKALFFHIDRKMIPVSGYSTRTNNYRSFISRLKRIIVLDMMIAMSICLGLTFIAYACGHKEEFYMLTPIFLGIVFLSVFYSIFYETIYYMLQPYTADMKIKNYWYVGAQVIMICVAYGCIYITVKAALFNIIVGCLMCVAYCVAVTLVFYYSTKTFKVRE